MLSAFHTAYIVEDLDAYIADAARAGLPFRWTPRLTMTVDAWTPEGRLSLELAGHFSLDPIDRVEIIQAVSDSPWAGNLVSRAAFHHIGFWSDDLAADSTRLRGMGCQMAATDGLDPEHPGTFTLHCGSLGAGYVQLVADSIRDALQRRLEA